MRTIPIEISTEQLLHAVERLPANELDAFVAQVNALRAHRVAPHLTQDETTLLLQINRASLDPPRQARFNELVAKRQSETITSTELQELMQLTDTVERCDVERLEALRDLAYLRNTTVPALMDALGIKAPTYG